MLLSEMFREQGEDRRRSEPLLLSVEEAHRKLGIGRTMFFAELHAGHIRSIKLGSRRLIPVSALQEFVDQRLADCGED